MRQEVDSANNFMQRPYDRKEFGKVCIMVTCMQYIFFIWHQMGTLQKKSYVHFYAISLITGCQEWLFEMIIIATWTFSCVIFAENIGIHGKCSLQSQHSYCYAAADSIPITKNIHTSLDAFCPSLPIYSKLSLEPKSHPWDNTGIKWCLGSATWMGTFPSVHYQQ